MALLLELQRIYIYGETQTKTSTHSSFHVFPLPSLFCDFLLCTSGQYWRTSKLFRTQFSFKTHWFPQWARHWASSYYKKHLHGKGHWALDLRKGSELKCSLSFHKNMFLIYSETLLRIQVTLIWEIGEILPCYFCAFNLPEYMNIFTHPWKK